MAGLSRLANKYLDQPMNMGPDVARVAKETGIQPMSRGEYLRNVVGAIPGIGDALAAAEGLQGAAEGDWGKAGLGALAAIPMLTYHMTPYHFEKFDLSKAKKGLGGMMHGRDIYTTDNPEGARLADLLEAYKNYRGVQDWKLGQMNRVQGYHGSPRAEPFTHFDSEFMGSGEGAQAFGKGHYVAERPGITKRYAEMQGPMYEPDLSEFSNVSKRVYQDIESAFRSKDPLQYLKRTLGGYKSHLKTYRDVMSRNDPSDVLYSRYLDNKEEFEKSVEEYAKYINELKLISPDQLENVKYKGPLRSLYEVSLEWPGARESVDPMSREHFFQWDKQFSSQPKHIKDALFDIIEQHPDVAEPYAKWLAEHNVPGHTTHSLLTLRPQDTIIAMEGAIESLMYERGIPGIAFLDQPSRTKKVGDRTYNYVVFGDEIPRIISHNNPSVLDMIWPKK